MPTKSVNDADRNPYPLDSGIAAHHAGNFDQAESHYLEILAETPDEPDAMRFLGILRHQQGRSDEGIECLRRSLALTPNAPGYNDLGNVLTQQGDLFAAGHAFLSAIELAPEVPDYWNNLGSVLHQQGSHQEAEEAYRGALAIDPAFAPALHNLGGLFTSLGQEEAAAEYYCRAYVLPPFEEKSCEMLGIAHYRLGDISAAAKAYGQWLLAEPDNPRAQHMHAACQGGYGPERASNAYIERTFDAYADDFENRLVGSLGYRGPQMIAQMLGTLMPPQKKLDVLDGGCGTGLCGPLLAPYARYLCGVDLSVNMLNKARLYGCYDLLEKAELSAYCQQQTNCYDLISMADTLIYFGDVAPLFMAVRQALRPGGLWVFTIETVADSAGYRINPSGRYSHSPEYIADLLASLNFTEVSRHAGMLRTEFSQPVAGMVFAARSA